MDGIGGELKGVQKNILLADYTTYKIGGPARYFFVAKNKKDLIRAVGVARKSKTPFFILGGGSNVLASDEGFDGLVIKVKSTELKIEKNFLTAASGILTARLVLETINRGFSGLEWAAGLPGTIGGAVRGNAGAFGKEIKDVVSEVECLDNKNQVRKLDNKQCQFAYRNSIFKKEDLIILSVKIKTKKGNKKEIQALAKEHIKYRSEKHPLGFPSCGSIFKNIDLKLVPESQKARFSKVIKTDPFPVVPSAFIISEAGLKGLKIGGAQVSEIHPNYIVNTGNAKFKDVEAVIDKVKERVKEKFGITLQEEVQKVYPKRMRGI